MGNRLVHTKFEVCSAKCSVHIDKETLDQPTNKLTDQQKQNYVVCLLFFKEWPNKNVRLTYISCLAFVSVDDVLPSKPTVTDLTLISHFMHSIKS